MAGNQSDRRSDYWRRRTENYFAETVIGRFDKDRSGNLEPNELVGIGLPTTLIDLDRDGTLSRDELKVHLDELEKRSGDLTQGLPAWFYELDVNRDDQVDMREFATQ